MAGPAEPAFDPSKAVLSQAEVESLLSQVQEQETAVVVFGPKGTRQHLRVEEVVPFDFRQPAFLAPVEMRRIRLRFEEFIRGLAANLSLYLRVEVGLRMSKLQTVSYRKLTEGLPNPTYLTLFKAEPLKGICLLDLPPRLGLTLVDRLLGGPGHSVAGDRDISDIESALLVDVVTLILKDWCNQWEPFEQLRPTVLGQETTPRFLQTSPHDTVMLLLGIETTLGDCVEEVQMAIPHYTVEPLVRHLAVASSVDRDPDAKQKAAPRWNAGFHEIPVRVTAEWQGLSMTARALGSLQPGDFLMLDPERCQTVRVNLAQSPKFRGRLGTRGQNWAVEITEVLPNPVRS